MSDDEDGMFEMSASKWFDDWREWIIFIASNDRRELTHLAMRRRAEGWPEILGAPEMIAHHGELCARAIPAIEHFGNLCETFAIDDETLGRLPPLERETYVRVPDSPLYGRGKGRYVKRTALEYTDGEYARTAALPLRHRAGLTCPRCRKHYPGISTHTSADASYLALRDGDPDAEGNEWYACVSCGYTFILVDEEPLTLREARRRRQRDLRDQMAAWLGHQLGPLERVISLFIRG